MLQALRTLAAATMLAFCATGVGAQEPAAPTTGPAVPPVEAQAPQDTAAPPAPTPTHELTAGDVEAFFDGMVPYALKRGDIAGATLSVVKDGEILFAKGYGFSNLEKRSPVIPDKTLFRPGSVSKLFTWTAVMQQVEQGKLDLDADVNTYLDFKIPDAFGAPITLRNIMTHTSGFEEIATDLFVYKAEDLYPLGDHMKKNIPLRIYPPGKVVAYSNYATSLAGYIVERVSGEKFADYIANHILKPLDMTRSTFEQPLPKAFEVDMSLGYRSASDGKPVDFELVESAPAGALTSTATDMARFMIAHLNGGAIGDARILSAETTKLMHSRNYSPGPPDLNGFNLGFYDEGRNGQRMIGHGGDTTAFHSDLHLILDANVGVFLSMNSGGKEGASNQIRVSLIRAFLDRYFPRELPKDPPFEAAKQDASRVVGSYVSSRRKESALRLLWLIGQANVTAEANGDIKIDILRDASGAPKLWRQIAPLRYREVGGQSQVVFIADDKGSILHFTTDDVIPVFLFQRAAPLEQSSVFGPAMLGVLGIFALTLVIWLGGSILRWKYGASLELTSGQLMWRLASRIGVILFLAVAAGWLGLIVIADADESYLFGAKGAGLMTILYIIGVASVVGGLAMIVNAFQRLTGGPGGILARGGELILAVAAVYAIWAVYNYGLLSFNTVI
jgi:CubicO group peptidase (beta-lactamase class C family)